MQYPTVEELILSLCNGHVGLLRIVIDDVSMRFEKASPTEHELIEFLFSSRVRNRLGRCFGQGHDVPRNRELVEYLMKCFFDELSQPPTFHSDSHDAQQHHVRLRQAGLLTVVNGVEAFSSVLAEQYFSPYLFPHRGTANPSTLHELLRLVLGKVSASVLKQSTTDNHGSAATFLRLFMTGIAHFTPPMTTIWHEPSRVLPSSWTGSGPKQRVNPEVDLYVHGDQSWGITL